MSLKQMPNRFGKIPKAQVLDWLNAEPTRVVVESIEKEKVALQAMIVAEAGNITMDNVYMLVRLHGRLQQLRDMSDLFLEASGHAGA